MPVPSESGRGRLRAALARTLDATASILRPTRTPDPGGGWIVTWATVSTLACSYAPSLITPHEQEMTTTVRAISFWRFVFAAGSDVRTSDRISIGSRTWEVVGGGESSLGLESVITAMEIQ